MKTEIIFAKVKPEAKIPSKRLEDAGYDVYACFEADFMVLPPHETVMVPTGIASACSTDYAFILKERGSTGTKGIAQRCGVIDSGYRGEWFVPVTNTTEQVIVICKDSANEVPMPNCVKYPYSKAISQVLVLPVPVTTIKEVTYEELQQLTSERGSGCVGSSEK